MKRNLIVVLILSVVFTVIALSIEMPTSPPADQGLQLRISVSDAEEKLPLELARVVLKRSGKIIAQDATNPAGQIRFRDIQPGRYAVTVWVLGYKPYADSLTVNILDYASLRSHTGSGGGSSGEQGTRSFAYRSDDR